MRSFIFIRQSQNSQSVTQFMNEKELACVNCSEKVERSSFLEASPASQALKFSIVVRVIPAGASLVRNA